MSQSNITKVENFKEITTEIFLEETKDFNSNQTFNYIINRFKYHMINLGNLCEPVIKKHNNIGNTDILPNQILINNNLIILIQNHFDILMAEIGIYYDMVINKDKNKLTVEQDCKNFFKHDDEVQKDYKELMYCTINILSEENSKINANNNANNNNTISVIKADIIDDNYSSNDNNDNDNNDINTNNTMDIEKTDITDSNNNDNNSQ